MGTYLAWEVHSTGWWGEGEIKFFMDGDKEFPTIAGTGTEDYFCGSYDFDTAGPDGKATTTPRPASASTAGTSPIPSGSRRSLR